MKKQQKIINNDLAIWFETDEKKKGKTECALYLVDGVELLELVCHHGTVVIKGFEVVVVVVAVVVALAVVVVALVVVVVALVVIVVVLGVVGLKT